MTHMFVPLWREMLFVLWMQNGRKYIVSFLKFYFGSSHTLILHGTQNLYDYIFHIFDK